MAAVNVIQEVIQEHQQDLLKTWEDEQKKTNQRRSP